MCNSKGFSLVELLVVMSIIAILIGISIPIYVDVIEKAEYSCLVADIKIYKNAANVAVHKLGVPEKTIVWGDSDAEQGEWQETTWLEDEVADGILVTISKTGSIKVSFEEESENFQKYSKLIERYGEINMEA